MFGRNWEPATATIVAKKFKEGGERSGARAAAVVERFEPAGVTA